MTTIKFIMKNNQGLFRSLSNDIPAGIVVFLVAVPLCLGIALASGAPLFSGIIAGIVGGVVVSLISGSALGVSGPAAGLAVIVLSAIQDLGSFEIFLVAVVLAGVIQILLGVLKSGIIAYYFPSSVIKGMLAAIGIIIFLKQIPHALGYDKDPEGELEFVQMDGQNTFSELMNVFDYLSPGALIIAVLSLFILVLWERPFMKRIKLFKLVQGPLIVVVLGIVLNKVFVGTQLNLRADQLVNIPVADSLAGFVDQFTLPDFSQLANTDIYVIALTMAVVASLETLLCVEATDKLDPEKRVTPPNRELIAQGAGNIVSGMIGGIPITQVIVRSSANIQSGGKTKMAAFIHGILILLSAFAIPGVLNMVPLASLAAILLVVGYKLAKPSLFKQMIRAGKSEYIPFLVTVLGIVFTDLLIGILMGLVVGVFQILRNNYSAPYSFHVESTEEDAPIRIRLSENLSFINKASILETLSFLPYESVVIIDGTATKHIHPDIMEIILDFKESAPSRGIKLSVIGLSESSEMKWENPVKKFSLLMKDKLSSKQL